MVNIVIQRDVHRMQQNLPAAELKIRRDRGYTGSTDRQADNACITFIHVKYQRTCLSYVRSYIRSILVDGDVLDMQQEAHKLTSCCSQLSPS